MRDEDIKMFRQEADEAGDLAMVLICDLALGRVESGTFIGRDVRTRLNRHQIERIERMSRDEAREEVSACVVGDTHAEHCFECRADKLADEADRAYDQRRDRDQW